MNDQARKKHIFELMPKMDSCYAGLCRVLERIQVGEAVTDEELRQADIALKSAVNVMMVNAMTGTRFYDEKDYETISAADLNKAFLSGRMGISKTQHNHNRLRQLSAKFMPGKTQHVEVRGGAYDVGNNGRCNRKSRLAQ